MGRVKNSRALGRLAAKSFGANRTRNTIASITIGLTAVLFTAVFTIGIGLAENIQHSALIQAGGDVHGTIKNLTRQQYDILKRHPSIRECGRDIVVANSVENPEFLKRHVEVHYLDRNLYPHWFVRIAQGTEPKAADEILMDRKSMELLGLEALAGSEVTLDIRVHYYSEPIKRTFRVSGVMEEAEGMNVGFVFVSEAYLEKYGDEIWPKESAEAMASSTGDISLQVLFADSRNIQERLDKIITDCGFSLDETSENYMASNANWAYLTDGVGGDPITIMGIGLALLLIVVTGYLIIYNIFQISIIRDIRYYGLLKTIGTTARQIRRILHRQALWLCLMGTPAGLFVGFLIGKFLFPIIADTGGMGEGAEFSVTPRPWIFAGAAVFTVLTVLISEWKPARIAGKVSPMEALRYTEYGRKGRKQKKTTDGGKLFKMAFSNLGRNRGRTAVVILSLSLTVILTNSVYTIVTSVDREGFLSKMILSEGMIGNAALWNHRYRPTDEQQAKEISLSESFIKACQQQEGFAEGGRIYVDTNGSRIPVESWEVPDYILQNEDGVPGKYTPMGFQPYGGYENGGYFADMYGIEPFVLSKMAVVEGETDKRAIWEKLQSDKYLLYGVDVDDSGLVIEDQVKYHAGDKVTLQCGKEPAREYEIIAAVKRHTYSLSNRIGSEFTFYIPAGEFKKKFSETELMSYLFDTKEGQERDMEEFLEAYTTKVEPAMSYDSRTVYEKSFQEILGIIMIVGTGLSGMIGLIGVLNFVNVTLTGIATRKREFAMMAAIGMTRGQLVRMLMAEGLCYSLLAMAASLMLGTLFSLTALRAVGRGIWFIHYQFTLLPMALACPALMALGVLVPRVVYGLQRKGSIVEELR